MAPLTMQIICMFSIIALVLATTPQQITADLTKKLSPGTQVVLTSDSSYKTDFRKRWTIYPGSLPTYSVAVKPKTKADIQSIIRYAAANKVPFMATGGGHGYSTTLSGVRNALDIDMSNFDSVSVNAQKNTMTIGGGTKFAQIYDPLYNAGKHIQTGGCSQPGMVGVTMGGGIGPLTGEHGLIIDALLSVEIVTGTGQILTASATQNADLFWGIRGAGFNFGIVTSATYRIYDATPRGEVYNADLVYPGELNGTIFKILKSYQGTQDDKLSISIGSSLRNNTPSITASLIYFGTKKEGQAAIKPFLDARPTESYISVVPYNQLVYTANFGSDRFASLKEVPVDNWGFNLNKIDVTTLISVYNDMIAFVLDNPAYSSGSWLIEKFGLGVTAAVPDSATAYAWRKTVGYGFFMFNLPNTTASAYDDVDVFAKQARSKLIRGSGNANGEVYVNYARGDETPEQMYGARKLPKLRSLKKQFDPSGLFNSYNAIR